MGTKRASQAGIGHLVRNVQGAMWTRHAITPLLFGALSIFAPRAGATVAPPPAGATQCPPATLEAVGCPTMGGGSPVSTTGPAGSAADDDRAVTAHRKPRVPATSPPPVVDEPVPESPVPETSGPAPAPLPSPEVPAPP